MNPNRGLHSKLFVNLYLAFTFFVHCGQLAEVDKAMVAKKLFLFSVHGSSISKGKGAGITQRIERKLRVADKVNTGKHRILLVM